MQATAFGRTCSKQKTLATDWLAGGLVSYGEVCGVTENTRGVEHITQFVMRHTMVVCDVTENTRGVKHITQFVTRHTMMVCDVTENTRGVKHITQIATRPTVVGGDGLVACFCAFVHHPYTSRQNYAVITSWLVTGLT